MVASTRETTHLETPSAVQDLPHPLLKVALLLCHFRCHAQSLYRHQHAHATRGCPCIARGPMCGVRPIAERDMPPEADILVVQHFVVKLHLVVRCLQQVLACHGSAGTPLRMHTNGEAQGLEEARSTLRT
jgi:hypothetical protein